jgi:hypothetical protein
MAESILMRMAKDEARDIIDLLNIRQEDAYEMMVAASLAYLEAAYAAGREEHDGTCWLQRRAIRGGCNKLN